MSLAELPIDIRELIKLPISHRDGTGFRLLPTGYYFGKVVDTDLDGQARDKTREDGTTVPGTYCWVFYVTPSEPAQDVTPEQLEGIELSNFKFPSDRFYGVNPATLWLHPNSMDGNREFFSKMGFPATKPMEDCANEMLGKRVLIGIGREPAQNGATNADGTPREYNVIKSLTGDPRAK